MKKVAIVLTILLAFSVGCSKPIENQARDGIASASGFLTHEVTAHTAECQALPSSTSCVAIKKAALSLDVVIDALEVYCGNAAFQSGGAPCQPPAQSTIKQELGERLAAALTDLSRDVGHVKELGGSH